MKIDPDTLVKSFLSALGSQGIAGALVLYAYRDSTGATRHALTTNEAGKDFPAGLLVPNEAALLQGAITLHALSAPTVREAARATVALRCPICADQIDWSKLSDAARADHVILARLVLSAVRALTPFFTPPEAKGPAIVV